MARRPHRRRAPAVGSSAILLLVLLVLAACAGESPEGDELPAEDVAQLASETVEVLDEAVALSEEQLLQAAAVASEAAARGELGTATPGAVVIGTNADFLPFVGRDAGGTLVGFDVELFDALATRLDVVATYTDMPFSTLTGALTAGEVDVAMAAITITDDREEVIDFTRPYFVGSQALAAQPVTTLTGIGDLDGDTTVAVLADTTGEAYARETFTEAVVTAFPDRATALGALTAGAADAVFMDTDAVSEQVREGSLVLLEEVPTAERYGIALPEGNVALRTALNAALEQVIEDGTYREMFMRWFPTRDVDQALSLLR